MLTYLSANLGTIAVAVVLAAIVAAVVVYLVRRRRKGVGCCSGCSGCAMRGACGKKD